MGQQVYTVEQIKAKYALPDFVQVHENPDIFQIPVPLIGSALGFINVYLIRGKNNSLLIDTGFNSARSRAIIWDAFEKIGLDVSKTALFITHFHSDHSGSFHNVLPQECPRYMSKIDRDRFYDFSGERYMNYLNMLVHEGFPESEKEKLMGDFMGSVGDPEALARVQCVDETDVLYVDDYPFVPLWMPGHTPGHLCLYQPDQQLLFLGDAMLFDISPNVSYAPGAAPMLASFICSLARLAELPVSKFFISHRSNKRGLSLGDRAEELMEHHLARLEDIRGVVRAHSGGVDAYTITRNIPWVSRGKGFDNLEILQVFFAMTETLAHIEWLLDEDELIRSDHAGVVRYSLV